MVSVKFCFISFLPSSEALNVESINSLGTNISAAGFNPILHGYSYPPQTNVKKSQNWRRPKACAFLTFSLIQFYTYCENLESISCLQKKLWGFGGRWLTFSYIFPYKAGNTQMTLISDWMTLETSYLHHSLILGSKTFVEIFVKIRHDDVT